MGYRAGAGGSIVVNNPNALPLSVTITYTSGASLTVYSDVERASSVAMPHSITARTTYYLAEDAEYTVSVRLNAVEIGTLACTLKNDSTATLNPSVDPAEYTANSPLLTVSTQTASYTLALTDVRSLVRMNTASASTLTVPPNSSVAFPVGTAIEVAQVGAGQVTLTAGGGVTLSSHSGLKTAAQYALTRLVKTATDTWLVGGDVAA